jgi:hypothetical protein
MQMYLSAEDFQSNARKAKHLGVRGGTQVVIGSVSYVDEIRALHPNKRSSVLKRD